MIEQVVDEVAVKDAFENICVVQAVCDKAVDGGGDPACHEAFEAILLAAKRAALFPDGKTKGVLLRAIARYENIYRAIPDPESGK